MRKIVGLIEVMLIVLVCVTTAAYAQQKAQLLGDYPNKPVRILVGDAPGGGTDFTARLMAAKLSERLSKSFLVENRAGGSGTIALDTVAKATPDGYTLMVSSPGHMVSAVMLNKLPYDVRTAFEQVANIISQPYVLVVNASLPVNSVQELIAYAKSNPGKLNFATSGLGSNHHLGLELLKSMTGVDVVHIPYKGIGPGIIDLIGGRVHVLFGSTISVKPHVNSGKMKALAVTSLKRSKLFPNLPSISEAGVPGFELTGGYGLIAPAGIPSALTLALNQEVNQILNSPEVEEKFAASGADIAPGSPTQYKDFIAREIDRWGTVIKKANIKLE
jgi:tripartite-type tricarboxylate transporter receptor subunit TctC